MQETPRQVELADDGPLALAVRILSLTAVHWGLADGLGASPVSDRVARSSSSLQPRSRPSKFKNAQRQVLPVAGLLDGPAGTGPVVRPAHVRALF